MWKFQTLGRGYVALKRQNSVSCKTAKVPAGTRPQENVDKVNPKRGERLESSLGSGHISRLQNNQLRRAFLGLSKVASSFFGEGTI